METSITSVTFRRRPVAEIAALARSAGLDAVEWGGDLHIPPGDRAAARTALRCCRENGLGISAYGSYYRAQEGEDFAPVLETALWLEAPVIRVWAGRQGSAEISPAQRAALADRLARAVEMAGRQGCVVATEYHAGTLTDTLASARALLTAVPGLRTFWQPPVGLPERENLLALQTLGPWLENLHVFNWDAEARRLPLAAGAAAWQRYLAAAERCGRPRYATLEFVRQDSETQLLQDAAVLHTIMKGS